MDYEKMYKDALERAKKIDIDEAYASQGTIAKTIFPELRESNDERIRKYLLSLVDKVIPEDAEQVGININDVLVYLEKQKYDRMQPVYDDLDSFESALAKAWKAYNDSGSRTVDGCEDDYVECAHAKGFREGYLFGLKKQKEQKHPNGCFTCDEYKKGYEEGRRNGFTAGYNKAMKEVEQKEQKPELPLMGGDTDTYFDDLRMTTKSLTSREWFNEGIKYAQRLQKEQEPNIELIQRSWYMEGYHDREFGKEPKWVIKTGEGGPKHELNPRYGQPLTEQRPTEEQLHNLNEAIKSFRMDGFDRIADSLDSLYNILKTQEQHPSSRFLPNDWVVYDGPLGHAILQVKDVVAGRYSFVDNDSTLLVEDSDKFLRPITPKDVEKKEEWGEEDEEVSKRIISDLRWGRRNSVSDKDIRQYDEEINWMENKLKSLRCHWKPSDEDEVRLINTSISFLKDFADKGYENAVECIDWLKSKLNGNTCE